MSKESPPSSDQIGALVSVILRSANNRSKQNGTDITVEIDAVVSEISNIDLDVLRIAVAAQLAFIRDMTQE